MPKISLVNKTSKIDRIVLKAEVACPIDNCEYGEKCGGKQSGRDNDFTCDLSELIELYKKAEKRNKK